MKPLQKARICNAFSQYPPEDAKSSEKAGFTHFLDFCVVNRQSSSADVTQWTQWMGQSRSCGKSKGKSKRRPPEVMRLSDNKFFLVL